MSHPNKNLKILIVDDVTRNIQVVGSILRKSHFGVAYAQSGIRALELAQENNYDLILLDVMMPEMNGFEVCKRLKANEKTKDIPVIFLTAKSDTESMVKGFELGGVDYIIKPFNGTELVARVKNHLDLKIAKQQLADSNSAKDKFFSILAHDLKNPLSTFKNVTELLRDNFDILNKEEQLKLLDTINATSNSLYELLENLLNWSRSQTGRIQFNPMLIDLKWIVNNNLSLLETAAETKSISLEINIPDNMMIFADTNMLNTIIRNLVSNAVKFTNENGKIRISAEVYDDNFVMLMISDTGVGINEEDLDKLFRIDIHYTKKGTNQESGTGLGLVLCKEFVEKNGGSITVESQTGVGSTFKMTFPRHQFHLDEHTIH